MSRHSETILLLSRINTHQERVIEILLGIQEKVNTLHARPPPAPHNRCPITVSDAIKLAVAVVFLWSALTGKLTPSDLLAILK